jgi:hypothetical protein
MDRSFYSDRNSFQDEQYVVKSAFSQFKQKTKQQFAGENNDMIPKISNSSLYQQQQNTHSYAAQPITFSQIELVKNKLLNYSSGNTVAAQSGASFQNHKAENRSENVSQELKRFNIL